MLCHVGKWASWGVPVPGSPWFHLNGSISLSVISHFDYLGNTPPQQGRLVLLSHWKSTFVVSYSPWQFLLQGVVIFALGKPSKELVGWAAQWQKRPSDQSAALILITASASYATYHCSFCSFIWFSLSLQLLLLISWLSNLHDPSFLLKDLFSPWWIGNCCRYWTNVTTCTEITRLQFLLFLDSTFASCINVIVQPQDMDFLALQKDFYPGLFTICS